MQLISKQSVGKYTNVRKTRYDIYKCYVKLYIEREE